MSNKKQKEEEKKADEVWRESQSPYGQLRLARQRLLGSLNMGEGFISVSRTHAKLLEIQGELVVGLGGKSGVER